MIKIADIVASLGHCVAAQRELDLCRARARGDIEYYSYSYVQDLKQAETELEQTLNAYIDQRLAQKLAEPTSTGGFEQPLAEVRAMPLAA